MCELESYLPTVAHNHKKKRYDSVGLGLTD